MPVNRPYASITNDCFTLTYARAKSATDVSLVVEQSNDLVTWQSGTNRVRQVNLLEQGAAQLITVQTAAPVSSNQSSFLRLRVARLP